MILDGKPIEEITEADLQYLVDTQYIETRQLEYKQELIIKSGDQRKEFLADVSAFANSAGGYLIFGIEEEDGIPVDLCGIEIHSTEATISQIENMMRDGIEPTVSGIQVHAIALSNTKNAIIIKIPQSWSLPHWVKSNRRFFTRHSNGKHVVDIEELRQLFTLRDFTQERIRQFRLDQITKIQEGRSPVPLIPNAIFVLHIAPFSMANASANYDVASLFPDQYSLPNLPLLNFSINGARHNFDGLLAHSHSDATGQYYEYTQFFRNGVIEAVSSRILLSNANDKLLIPSKWFEAKIREALPKLINIQNDIQVSPPFLVMLSLLRVSGYKLAVERIFPPDRDEFGYHPIGVENLILPESLISDYEFDVDKVLRPLFDMVWNAGGYPKSKNYDEDGNWIEDD